MQIMLTGASGFVGERFMEINGSRFDLVPVSLRGTNIEEIDLTGIDSIVHLAGKAHEMKPVDDQVYYDVNYGLTKKLAEWARHCGVPHFVYISSVKVYGDETPGPLNEQSPCLPTDAYGKASCRQKKCSCTCRPSASG